MALKHTRTKRIYCIYIKRTKQLLRMSTKKNTMRRLQRKKGIRRKETAVGEYNETIKIKIVMYTVVQSHLSDFEESKIVGTAF